MFAIVALMLCVLSSSSVGFARADWQLTWNDEFNGSSLDSSKWDIEVNCWGGGNGEKQCYTSRLDNVFVSGGSLHLRPVAGTYTGSLAGCTLNNENSCTWTQPATSGRVRTLNAVGGSWTYGRFEVRAKLPKGNFLWPAIWMLPTDNVYGTWAASGEIDIMESRGQVPTQISSTIHYGGAWPNNVYTTSGDMTFAFDFTNDFHVFALEWDATLLKFYVDAQLTWTQSLQRSFGSIYPRNGAPFDQKFHMLLNVAVAGGFFDPNRFGTFDINTASPTWTQDMQIDYVRVYKWVDTTTSPQSPTPIALVPTPVPTTSAPVSAPSSPTTCSATSLQFPLFPIYDAHVDALRPRMTFGRDVTLQLRGSLQSTQGRVAYVKFYLPKTRVPSRAAFSMWGSLEDEAGNMNVTIQGVDTNQWTEDSLTWSSRPSACTTCASATQMINTTATWTTWDVLPIIAEAMNQGKDVVSFRIALSAFGHAAFNSADAPTNRPILNLAY